MTREWQGGTVRDMASSHSPFLADPDGLAAHVADILSREGLSDRTSPR